MPFRPKQQWPTEPAQEEKKKISAEADSRNLAEKIHYSQGISSL
jgi:hypothetical protein